MLSLVIRFSKRLVVLVPVLVIAYVSAFNIFPWLHDRLPVAIAVMVTYIVGAYVLVPAILRIGRIWFPPKHLPYYCVTADGFASDPLNVGVIGTRQELIDAMTAAGWHGADGISIRSVVRLFLSTVYGWRYDRAPMSLLFLFGRQQDLSFQMPITDGNPGSRHHVRFWAATYHENGQLTVRSIHWHNRQAHVRDDRLLWLGAASRDIGVTFIRHNAQLTHLVDPNTNAERELLVSHLAATGRATLKRTITLNKPYQLMNIHALRGHVLTDGQMAIMEISPKTAGSNRAASKRKQK